MKRSSSAAIGLLLALLGAQSHADEADVVDTRPYISIGGSYVFEDATRDSDGGEGYWLGVGKSFNRFWGLEFSGFRNDFDASRAGGPEWQEQGAEVSALYYYARGESFAPYFSLGAGWVETEEQTSGADASSPFGAAGVGFFKSFALGSTDLGVRGDVRYRWLDADDIAGVSPFEEAVVRLGLVVPLGSRAAPTETPVAAPAPVTVSDADGDGVPDGRDTCPDTASGTTVDANGCPPPLPPATDFEPVSFPFDESGLTDYAKAILDRAAARMRERLAAAPDLLVQLSGHTDWIGTEGYNQALSERRAASVRDYLVSKGVDGDRVRSFAFGETRPVDSNETEDGRARNRRVELQLSEG